MGRHFQFFETLDSELVVNPLGQNGSDSGNRPQHLLRLCPSLEPIEPAPVSEVDHIGDGQAQRLTDRWQGDQSREPVAPVDDRGRLAQSLDAVGTASIGPHAVWVGVLGLEKVGRLSELTGYLPVEHIVGEGERRPLPLVAFPFLDGICSVVHSQSLAPERGAPPGWKRVLFGPVHPWPGMVHS